MGSIAARAYIGLGAALIALHLAIGGSDAIYDAIGLMSVAAIALGIAYYRPANWRGWAAIAFSQALFTTGDIVHTAGPPSTFPSVVDALDLTGYVFIVGGLILLMSRSLAWRDIAGHIDTLLITVALGMSGWMLFLDGRFRLSFGAASVVSIAYPAAVLLCVGVLIRIALAPGRRNTSYWLMLAAVLPLFVSDGTYVSPALSAAYTRGGWLDAGWLGSYVLLGAAALHPSMRTIAASGAAGRVPQPLRRVVVGGIALLTLPLSVIVENARGGGTNVPLVGAVGTVVLAAMVVRAVLLVRDLEELRERAEQSERRFRMVFERAPIGISVGRDGIMSETNPALQRMLGYTGEEFAHMRYTDVTHPDQLGLDVQAELDAGLRDSFTIEKQYVRKDGTPVETRVHVVLDLDDGLGMSLIEDVTERRQLEEQLLQAQKMEAIGSLAGGVAHDFNNLMTAVIGYSDLLLRRDDPETRAKLEAIRDAAVRASNLTRQLLAFSRRQMLQVDDLDLRDVVMKMDTLLGQLIGEDVRLETLIGPEPVVVRADQAQLEQVVMNLAVNARDAMPGGGKLTIGVHADGESAVLTVTDDGIGMDSETEARAFEPYFTTKPLTVASGLGLSTVHGIVGQSGGTIDLDSEPGRGTVVTIRLPLVTSPQLPEAAAVATLVD